MPIAAGTETINQRPGYPGPKGPGLRTRCRRMTMPATTGIGPAASTHTNGATICQSVIGCASIDTDIAPSQASNAGGG